MNLNPMLQAMTPEVYERLKQAVETGKWPDGSVLSDAQKASSMQAVMLYQAKVLDADQHMSINAKGQIVHKSKQQLKQQFSQQSDIAKFKEDDF